MKFTDVEPMMKNGAKIKLANRTRLLSIRTLI